MLVGSFHAILSWQGCITTGLYKSLYLLYLVGLQEITGFSEVGFERFWLKLRLDGCAMLGVHLFLGGDLHVQINVRYAYKE